MNPYITGSIIRQLREAANLTQNELSQRLGVSDKTVSKWETGKGYPDITLLEPIASVFRVSVAELLSGNCVSNQNRSANMLRCQFYVCPVCGNVFHSMGQAVIHCHGIPLTPALPEIPDEGHAAVIETIEDELYIRIPHPMTKNHFISFVAALSSDRAQLVKLYPEGEAEVRFPIRGVSRIVWYCNRDGLFAQEVRRFR